MRVPLATEQKYFICRKSASFVYFFVSTPSRKMSVGKRSFWKKNLVQTIGNISAANLVQTIGKISAVNLVQTIGKISAVNQLFWGNV